MNPTVYVMGGLTLTVAVMWGWWTLDSREKNTRIEAADAMVSVAIRQVDQAKAVNEENLATIATMKANEAAFIAAHAKAEADAHKRDAILQQRLRKAANAPVSDDGPVNRILRDSLDQLNRVQPVAVPDKAADGPNQDTGGTAGSAEPVVSAPADPARP
jgi:hypothetical protein